MGGQDKGLLMLNGKPLAAQVLAQLQCWPFGQIWLSANRNLSDYASLGCTVLTDLRPDYPGPLAGIEAALKASAAQYLLVVPCDVPSLPSNLLDSLLAAIHLGAPLAYAVDAQRRHPAICLLSHTQLPVISTRLNAGERSLWRWQDAAGAVAVHFDFDFPNLNELTAISHIALRSTVVCPSSVDKP